MHILTLPAQRMPECDMALVHDDDLAQINGICNNVSTHFHWLFPHPSLVVGNPGPSIRCSDTPREAPTKNTADSVR